MKAVAQGFGLVALLALVACGGETRDRGPVGNNSTSNNNTSNNNTTNNNAGPDAGVCGGEVCSAADESMTCCCPATFTCGRWTTGCECIPPPGHDAGTAADDSGVPPADDAGTPIDAGQPPADAGTPPVDAGFPDSGMVDLGPPVYGGNCPTFTNGENSGFMSDGTARRFILELPQNPFGAPVIFAWHWWQGEPRTAIDWTGLAGIAHQHDVIVISPYPHPNAGSQWYNAGDPRTNPDVLLFDDLLACLNEQFQVDLDRVYAHGHSMGGLFISYLVQHRSNYLAAFAPLSGGLADYGQRFTTPQLPIPGYLLWGGPSDTFGNFSFETASLELSRRLRANGSFVLHCVGDFGHALPPMPEQIWPFFRDHVRGQPSPYASGVPGGTFPGICRVP